MNFSPLTKRRFKNFKANKRGAIATITFCFLFLISIFAEFIANDKPILLVFDNKVYFPVFQEISETFYGGEFETEADYKDPFVKNLINQNIEMEMVWFQTYSHFFSFLKVFKFLGACFVF